MRQLPLVSSFDVEETEAQRGQVICLKSHSSNLSGVKCPLLWHLSDADFLSGKQDKI